MTSMYERKKNEKRTLQHDIAMLRNKKKNQILQPLCVKKLEVCNQTYDTVRVD